MMTTSSFLLEFCCGCCIQQDEDNDYAQQQRHESYHKYYSRSERGAEPSRHSSHAQLRSGHPPSSHTMIERQYSQKSESRRKSDSRNHDELNKNHSTLSSRRKDDASVMGASLSETYQRSLVEEDDEFLDEQSAIRRSLKSGRGPRKKQTGNVSPKQQRNYQSEPERASSSLKKSNLESYIEEKTKTKSRSRSSHGEDLDNVTTISKASKNPYRVLGLSPGATPREIFDSYKARREETHPNEVGGSERAFQDVTNAYRRLRAELKRQEARKERSSTSDIIRDDKTDKKYAKKKPRKKSRHKENAVDDEEKIIVRRRESIDGKLKDHRQLVHNLFANDAKEVQKISSNSSVSTAGPVTTLQKSIYSQSRALMSLSLVPIEGGATNINEKNKTINNSCFYLSLAASYLSGAGAFETDPTAVYYLNAVGKNNGNKSSDASVSSNRTLDMAIASLPKAEKTLTMSLALQLKRAIEAAVVLVHPHWASDGMVGEEVQAFSDFLVYALDSDSLLGHWAIAVFDEASGFVDIYRGRHYGKTYPPKKVKKRYNSGRSIGGQKDKSHSEHKGKHFKYTDCDAATRRAHTLTIKYIPGHYQPLLPELTKLKRHRSDQNGSGRPTLEDIINTLEKWKVLHVVTDGRAR